MSHKKFTSVKTLYNSLPQKQKNIMNELRELFMKQPGVVENIRRDCFHYRFPNGMWCYVNCRKRNHPVLGVSRGAWMVKQQPVLGTLFDEVKAVVGKIIITDIEIIEKKAIGTLIQRIGELPSGIGVR